MTAIRRMGTTIDATIPSGQAVTAAIDLGDNYALAGLLLPAIDNAAITFRVSADGATFRDLYDDAGNEVTIPASTGDRGVDLPDSLAPWRWLIIRSGTAAVPVNQTADRTLTVVLKS